MPIINWLFNWSVLILTFGKELAKSVYDVMLNVINPSRISHSAIVEIPLDVKSELGIVLLANMITLTPGTTTLHISSDKTRLYAHVMNYSESTASDIKEGFEQLIMKVLR